MLTLSPVGARRRCERARDRLPRRRHRDRLRRDDARAHAGEPGLRGHLGRARGAEASASEEARASAEAFLAAAAVGRGRGARLPGRLPALQRRRGEGAVRGSEGRVDPQLVLTHTRARPPPGPPARLRADVEHVPQPPDPRVRDPEVSTATSGRRTSSCRSTEAIVEEKLDAPRTALPEPGGEALVRRETFRGLMRLRGLESAAPERFAEAFTCRKLVMAP